MILADHRKYFESDVALYYLRSYNYRLDRHFPPFPRSDFSAQSHSHTVTLSRSVQCFNSEPQGTTQFSVFASRVAGRYLHSIYTVSTQCLHSIYRISTQYLHSIYRIPTQYLQIIYTVSPPNIVMTAVGLAQYLARFSKITRAFLCSRAQLEMKR